MLSKILNIFNKGKIMDDVKVEQEVIAEEVEVKEVKKEKAKKEDKSSWFLNTDAE
jgi:hypothetical protein